jgi:drug/metabolite transporter (DMT)-like permease
VVAGVSQARNPSSAPAQGALADARHLNRVVLGTLLVALGATLFGTLSYIARQAAETGLAALPFVAWRGIAATAALLLVSLLVGHRLAGGGRLPDIRVLPRDRRFWLMAAAMCGALLNIAVFAAFLRTSVAVALICFYTFPAMVTLAAVPLYGERLNAVRVGALLLSSFGLVLVVLAPLLGAEGVVIDPLGVGLALFGAVCQATFVLISGRGWHPMPTLHVSIYVVGAALGLSVPLAIVAGEAAAMLAPFSDPETWVWILAGGITGAAIPTTAFITGIGLIGPSRAAILMTIEPVVGVTLAALLLGEQPGVMQLVGGGAVLVAAGVLQIAPRSPVPPEPEFGPLV